MSDPETPSKTADDATLALLRKEALCELITWETVLALFSQALENGGPAGAVYGYIITWFSTMSVYTVISELASMAPIAGGQYYWVYMMAPPKYKRISSYIVGWLTTLAWVATVATETLFAELIVQGILVLDYPEYENKMYQGTLLTWAVILGCIFINVVIPAWLPRFEVFILVFHLAGFVAILVTLLIMTPSLGSAESVWLAINNGGGWPTQGLSYCVGFLGNVATFVGADASVHLAEEVSNAAVNIPRAILGAMLINGSIGFAMMVTVLYCPGDVQTVLETKIGYPFIQVFYDSVRNVAGATVMAAVVLALTWACATGITTTASRMTWSFARDRGLPFSNFLGRVSSRSKVPVNAVLVVAGIAALLSLIYIGSYTAFNDVISLTITGFYGSYLLPAGFLLYHRIKGNVLPRGTELDTSPSDANAKEVKTGAAEEVTQDVDGVEVVQARLVWGPWHLPGILGIINNVYACVYMVFVIFWSVWPPATPVSASTMNYSVVVTGGVMILSAIWYFIGGKKQYQGPLIDDEVASIMRAGSTISVH
ncbi:Choline transport protein [Fulvia fulva]|uniref:Choline transport protein n=1 Tax=Passalora fulva TaxID=5499 RepID=A0A9Q8LD80_PASFU|nr:Choline transport protein [Fulvia fulva]KAK4628811.1 Choline transport protein [Fulvia fulva]KAK4630493.1 Choline transport protein [Fulvia fulva]UJO15084.1 Choline transport protein [Fulvia fulva]WPV12462.1 Choline transport protein [Fulvia fulva]WPV27224.1 Choline transport protein [Fulvia fulva]